MSRKNGGIKFESVGGATLDRILERKQQTPDYIPTPFPGWNTVCGEEGAKKGLSKGWVITLGGVTGTGKSYLALNLAASAVAAGHRVGCVNFEMSQMAMVTRFLSILTGVPKYKLEMGDYFDVHAWKQAHREADRIQEETGGVFVTNESTVFSIEDVEESFRILTDAGIEMVIVDYAQLVTVPGTDGIYQRSEEVATRLRELTHEYGVVTVPISQFNREEAKRNKPPSIHGLLGGGIWEHASNQIWLLNHTLRYRYGRGQGGAPKGEYTELLGGKNRHGMEVALRMAWEYDTMSFTEIQDPTNLVGDHPFVDEGENVVTVDVGPGYSRETVDMFDDMEEE